METYFQSAGNPVPSFLRKVAVARRIYLITKHVLWLPFTLELCYNNVNGNSIIHMCYH